jgi:hypothetical protein
MQLITHRSRPVEIALRYSRLPVISIADFLLIAELDQINVNKARSLVRLKGENDIHGVRQLEESSK